eukprot:7067824-Alexandrium_andersonii.AAC.1
MPRGLATVEGSPAPQVQPMPHGQLGARSGGAPHCLRLAHKEDNSPGVGGPAAAQEPEDQLCEPQATGARQ